MWTKHLLVFSVMIETEAALKSIEASFFNFLFFQQLEMLISLFWKADGNSLLIAQLIIS